MRVQVAGPAIDPLPAPTKGQRGAAAVFAALACCTIPKEEGSLFEPHDSSGGLRIIMRTSQAASKCSSLAVVYRCIGANWRVDVPHAADDSGTTSKILSDLNIF